jgi:hypothetical protein
MANLIVSHLHRKKRVNYYFLDGCRKYFKFFLLLPSQSCPASPTCPVSVLSCHYCLSCVSPPYCHTTKKTCPVSVLSCNYCLSCVSPPSCHTAKKTFPVSVLSCHYRLSCVSPPSSYRKKQCSMDMSLEDVPYYKQYAVMIPRDYIRGLCSKLFLLITTVTTKQ